MLHWFDIRVHGQLAGLAEQTNNEKASKKPKEWFRPLGARFWRGQTMGELDGARALSRGV